MTTVVVRMSWSIEVDTEELRLILKALGGRLKEEDINPAKELGDKLTVSRAVSAKSALAQADHLLKMVENNEAIVKLVESNIPKK